MQQRSIFSTPIIVQENFDLFGLMLYIYINIIYTCTCVGDRKGGIGRSNWFRPETDKQLVHKSKEKALEAF